MKLKSLQVFRGLAALAVVVHHAAISTDAFVAPVPYAVQKATVLGALGVDFFFVLSGFIIFYVHNDDSVSYPALRSYSFKRITRIYPVYLPIGLGLMVAYAMLPSLSESGGRNYSFWSSVFLVPANHPPALSVAWTLVHELVFYCVFGLYFLSRRLFSLVLVVWATVIVSWNLLSPPLGWLSYLFSTHNLQFLMGIGAALYLKRSELTRIDSALLLVGLCILVVTGYLMLGGLNAWVRLVFAFGVSLCLVCFARKDLSGSSRWSLPLLVLGNASYSIYLIHGPVLSLSQRFVGQMSWLSGWAPGMVFGCLVAVAAGLVYYGLVEKPALRLFRKPKRQQLAISEAISEISN